MDPARAARIEVPDRAAPGPSGEGRSLFPRECEGTERSLCSVQNERLGVVLESLERAGPSGLDAARVTPSSQAEALGSDTRGDPRRPHGRDGHG